MSEKRKILVTTALPYANGSLHLGHILENLLADYWTRFLKMQGHEVYFFCADDTHGTPVMLAAQKQKISPEQMIAGVQAEHQKDFKGFLIEHTHYSSTNSETNRELCYYFYKHMQEKNLIGRKSLSQLYCDHDKMFLPDRFVKGECPKCGALDQYGDACEVCSTTYNPKDLKNPYCSVCSNPPTTKDTEQLVFKLGEFREFLKQNISKITHPSVAAKMKDWLDGDLRDWDISRNAPYFGFEIPGEKDKYFYVWLDAPMGYISTSKEYFDKNQIDYQTFWAKGYNSEVYHFIGKDITYFHTLFWPASLEAANFRLPTEVLVHGFVNVNGQKMSKSKGTFILGNQYLEKLDPQYLRYYFASKLSTGQDDLDFNIDDFVARTNGELIGKIVNLFSRSWSLLKPYNFELQKLDSKSLELLSGSAPLLLKIEKNFEAREFHQAIAHIRELADNANRYFDNEAPWKLAKTDPDKAHQVLSLTVHLARQLAICLKPVLPVMADKVAALFKESSYSWSDLTTHLGPITLNPYENLMNRIDPDSAKAILTVPAQDASAAKATTTQATTSRAGDLKPEIEITDFEKIDLRVAKVTEASFVEGADKLLCLQVDLGPLGQRQIFAGIRQAYPDPSVLVGKNIVVVANLKPRKMKFGLSQGMSLAAGSGGKDLVLVSPIEGGHPGDAVK